MKKMKSPLFDIKSPLSSLKDWPSKLTSIDELEAFERKLRQASLKNLTTLKLPIRSTSDAPIDVIDFFCGCGGMTLGFENVSSLFPAFKTIGAVDIDEHANNTFKRNTGVEPKNIDVRSLVGKSTDKLHSMFGRNTPILRKKPLIMIGCAPCQGFSSHRKKDKRKDSRNSLIGCFSEIITTMRPDVVLMENVPDLLSHKHWAHFQSLREALVGAGYVVKARVVNSAEYGVPQERFRAVILAFRHDFDLPRGHLTRNQFRTVRDAIESLPTLKPGPRTNEIDPMHITSMHREETIEVLKKVPKNGGSRPYGVGPKCLDKVAGFYDVYGRLAWDKPAVTITARCRTPSCGRFAHPEQDRGLSVREAALLQSFPRSYHIEGPFDDKFKQIGNAVPPALSTALATHILYQLLKHQLFGNAKPVPTTADHITEPLSNSYSSVIAWIKTKPQEELSVGKK